MNYYLLLLGIVFLNIKLKKEGGFYLWIGFYLFLISAVVNIAKSVDLSEVIIRIGFVFLLIGFASAVREYKTDK